MIRSGLEMVVFGAVVGGVFAFTGAALAQEPMSGAEFGAYVTGKTLTYGTGADPYGGEDYLPGNRVRWSFLDGRCLEGRWYEETGAAGPQICFVYDDDPTPICWIFYQGPDGLSARLEGDPDRVLHQTGEAEEPLFCLGPEVGV